MMVKLEMISDPFQAIIYRHALKHIDVTRTTDTSLDVTLEKLLKTIR